jgi:hypothetical protein
VINMAAISAVERPRARRDEPLPFKRDEIVAGNKFMRLVLARAIAHLANVPLGAVVSRNWPNDPVLELVTRATSAPAMTSVAGWAAELAQKLVYDSLKALEPMSAGAQLLRGGLVLNFDHYGSISVPGFVAAAASAGFVAEGQPIPVRQLTSAAVTLLPYKIGSIAALTIEMMESSNAEAMISDALMRSAGAALDMVLFDSNAASAARPAGLRYGIAALTASTNADLKEAFLEDVTALFNAVARVGGQDPYVLVTSAGRAMSLRGQLSAYTGNNQELLTGLVLGTPAVGNDIIAVATSALVSAFSADPDIEAANAATLVMDDTAPVTPNTTQPTKSLYQTASIGIRMRWPISWALRDARGVAWLTPTWK